MKSVPIDKFLQDFQQKNTLDYTEQTFSERRHRVRHRAPLDPHLGATKVIGRDYGKIRYDTQYQYCMDSDTQAIRKFNIPAPRDS